VAFRSARCCASARLVEVDLLPQAQQLDGGAARIAAILGERSVVVRWSVAEWGRNSGLSSSPAAGGQGVSGEKYFWPSSKHATSGTLMPSEWRQDVLYGPYIRQNDWKK
jgi:hypothetical protein